MLCVQTGTKIQTQTLSQDTFKCYFLEFKWLLISKISLLIVQEKYHSPCVRKYKFKYISLNKM